MQIEDMWGREAPDHVVIGEVLNAQGNPLDLRRLIQYRWGWTKSIATRVADFLEEDLDFDTGTEFPIAGAPMARLQARLFEDIDDLCRDLMVGISKRAYRDAPHLENRISTFEVSFEDRHSLHTRISIADEGMINGFVNVIAGRLGVTPEALREIATFRVFPAWPDRVDFVIPVGRDD